SNTEIARLGRITRFSVMASEQKQVPDSFKEYEDGKHRRYSLLFAVNGGAFAIAKVLSEPKGVTVPQGLSLTNLAYGMMLFTVVMVVDIYLFGMHLRSTLPKDPSDKTSTTTELF